MTIGSRPNSAIQSKNPSVFKSNPVYPVDDNLAPTDSTPRSESQQSILKTVTEILDGGTGRLKTAAHSLVLESVLATEIKVRCVFLRIGDIDTLNERYYAEVLFEASWTDPLLKFETTYDPNVHWNPNLIIINSIGDQKRDVWYSLAKSSDSDCLEITEHQRIKGLFWEKMELQHFPVDVQELSIQITTGKQNQDHTNSVKFLKHIKKQSGVNRTIFTDEQEWYLYEHVEININEQIEQLSDNLELEKHNMVTCSCHVA
ncbi:unnamed protein product, partial [Didymodactylos carnosus]